MWSSIRLKLFLLIVLGNILMVGLLISLNAASFSRSFSEYVAQQEARRLQPLIENIAQEYAQQGDWRWVRWDSTAWLRTVRDSFSPRELRALERTSRPNAGMPMEALDGFLGRLALKEAPSERWILGGRGPRVQRIWLPVPGTEASSTIAYLGYQPAARLDNQFDALFARNQQRQLVFIGLAGIALAGLLAVPFSGWLVRPIQRLSGAVREMTQGNLTVSVPDDRQDELGRLAADFNQLARALAKNQADRQQWVSDIAHELRTPVALFLADIEAAQDGVRIVDDQWLANLHVQVERLTRLVNDLHLLSQSDAGTLNYRFESVELGELLDEFFDQCAHHCADHHLALDWQTPDTPCWVAADAARLNQLFSNLLQNTVRYTQSDPSLPGTLSVKLRRSDGRIRVLWDDSAPGVADSDLSRLFERLYRVDASRSRDTGGAGLGLAIVHNIVEAHGGKVSARHSSLGGLRIELELPETAQHD